MAASQLPPGNCQSGLFTNAAVGVPCVLSATKVRPGCITANVYLCAATMESQPITRSALAVSTFGGVDGVGAIGDLDMAPGSATLLGQATGVLGDHALAIEVRGHAQQRADGDDPCAPHAAHHNAPGGFGHGQHGFWDVGQCRQVALLFPSWAS